METLLIPVFGKRISPRLDYAEHYQLLTISNRKVEKKETIQIITNNRLERINRIIKLNPDLIICNGLTERCYLELTKAKIKIIPWIKGEVEAILKKYFDGYFRENGKHKLKNIINKNGLKGCHKIGENF